MIVIKNLLSGPVSNKFKRTISNSPKTWKLIAILLISLAINYCIFIVALNLFWFEVEAAASLSYFSSIFAIEKLHKILITGKSRFKLTYIIKILLLYIVGASFLTIVLNYINLNLDFSLFLSWFISTTIFTSIAYIVIYKFNYKKSKDKEELKWNGISKLQILQNIASMLIAYVNPAVTHNLEKYHAIKKAIYLSAIEDIEGDYIEFGVYEGSSLCHAIRCFDNLKDHMPRRSDTKINFYGFDSFDGFGSLDKEDEHPAYNDEQFKTSYESVLRRLGQTTDGKNYNLIEGFFEETLNCNPEKYGIKKARVIFIDTDTYTSSFAALQFSKSIIIPGTIIILDDFFSYRGSSTKGVAGAFNKFLKENRYNTREIYSYGMGGKVFIFE